MQLLFLAITFVSLVHGGIISDDHHGIEHHEGATSFQNIHMEHFHPVPTYIRKEHKHLLEHPISIGKTSSKVEIHHGNKHDYGYAIADFENNIHNHGGFHGFEAADDANIQVHDQGEEYAQHQGQIEEGAGEGLGHYGLGDDVDGYHQTGEAES